MKSKPRILMFAPLCYPPAGSEAIVTSKLLLAMLDAGWGIDVISQADFGHYYPVNENGVWEPVKKVIHNIPAFKNGSYFKRFKSLAYLQSILWTLWTKKAVKVAHKLISEKKYNFILSRATPLYGHLPALIIAKKTGIPWVANWSDPLPPNKLPPPYGFGPSAHIPIYLKKYCDAVAHRAIWHTFPCDRLRIYVSSYLPQIKNKSSVIPHIALSQFSNNSENNTKEFSICHIGSLANRDPRIFLEGLKQFLSSSLAKKDVAVRFVGTASEKLENMARDLGLSHIIVVEPPKSYLESQAIMAHSTVLLLIEAQFEEGVFFPSKFMDYIQTGRPILAVSPTKGTLTDIISLQGGGMAADCKSAKSIAMAIDTLYKEWKTQHLNEKYGSFHLFDTFSENKVIGMYEEIFDKIQVISNFSWRV